LSLFAGGIIEDFLSVSMVKLVTIDSNSLKARPVDKQMIGELDEEFEKSNMPGRAMILEGRTIRKRKKELGKKPRTIHYHKN
jgi:Lhr-like helicase